MRNKSKTVQLRNARTGEVWISEDYWVRRSIDGAEFIEVHKPDSSRTMWINVNSVERIAESTKKSLT